MPDNHNHVFLTAKYLTPTNIALLLESATLEQTKLMVYSLDNNTNRLVPFHCQVSTAILNYFFYIT